jgi:hypothetical protein
MTKVLGLEEMKWDGHLQQELQQGGKFVMYQYCITLLIITFKRSSNIYFISHSENAVVKGLPFTLLSLVLGWWGIPWGPIYTIQSIWVNFKGGKDVTQQVAASIKPSSQSPG